MLIRRIHVLDRKAGCGNNALIRDMIKGTKMKVKKVIFPVIGLGFMLSVVLSSNSALAQKKNEEKIFIPKPVRAVLQEGLATRTARQDIPFTITRNLYLPAKENVHSIFFFKMKNADLGFAPLLLAPKEEIVLSKGKTEEKKGAEGKKEGGEKKEAEEQKTEMPGQLSTNFNVFLLFQRLKDKNPVEIVREVFIPVNLIVEGAAYNPEKEEMYSTGCPLPSGDYLLAIAVTSPDLKKIGTVYYEFSLPNLNDPSQPLDTTPIFFVKDIKQTATAETVTQVHKDYFVWYFLQMQPKTEPVFAQGEYLDIFFYIFGARLNAEGKNDIVINFEVLQNSEKAIIFAPQPYASALVSQPLRMKQTVIIKQEGVEVRKEERDLKPGTYTLVLNIKDNLSAKTVTKSVDFEIK